MTNTKPASRPHPVLLLHGQPGGARDWDRVVGALSGARAGDRVRSPRLGWRAASRGISPATPAAALAALDAAGADRAIVVGHSFGAAVAAWLATASSERVGALVLLAPSANVASLQWIDHLLAAPILGPGLSAAAVGGPGLVLAAPHIRRRLAVRYGLDADYLGQIGSVLRRPRSRRTFLVEQRALIRDLPTLASRLPRIVAPTTIVIGSADRVVPPYSAKLLAGQIPHAQLVPLKGAGHLLSLQHADRVAQLTLLAAERAAQRGAERAAQRGASARPDSGPAPAADPSGDSQPG